jgi:hypothetical protein
MSNHVSIFSMIKTDDKGYTSCQLFAYSSKSLPTIEIIGMGKRGKIIKEKIIYWLKKRNIKLSAQRFVICLESFERINFDDEDSVRWLELPSLILLLVLSQLIPLSNIDRCFCVGHLGLEGNYCLPSSDIKYQGVFDKLEREDIIFISHKNQNHLIKNKSFDFEDILAYIQKSPSFR